MTSHVPGATTHRPLPIALAGLLALAVAMGIGRFAFTPLLPLMLHDGLVDLAGASWLATANYLGYWVGALACALQPALWQRRGWPPVRHTAAVKAGLVLTVVLTAGMALPLPALWPLWRFGAGVASALVFVYVAGWVLARLALAGAPALAGLIFVGPGLGIAASGLAATAMVAGGVGAATGWAVFAAGAAVLSAIAWTQLRGTVAAGPAPAGGVDGGDRLGLGLFTLAYGLAGFGYIVSATFLPVIARQLLPGGSVWLDLFWPLFGLGVALGALTTLRIPGHWDRRRLLAGCYGLQAAGILLGVWWPGLFSLAAGSLLLGVPFTALTLFAVQEARRVRPHDASAFIGLLTASFGLGQIAGPPLVAALLARSATPADGFALALEAAAGGLLIGALIYAGLARRAPLCREAPHRPHQSNRPR